MTVGVPRETRAARPRGALAAATLVLAALVFAFAAHPYTRLPFAGEHGLYSHGAQQLAAGGVPYRDFCGHDGIGIYLLHFAAHEAFGYTMSALRLFDLAWMLAAFALLYAVCRRGFGPLAAAFAVLFAVITYFSLGYRPTAQRDGFALLPLLLALRLQFEVGRSRGRDHALHLGIGLAMAGVFWLKPPLAALGVVFALAPLFAERGRTADALLRAWPGLAGGFLLGVGAGVAYLARHGALLDAHECLIVYNLEYAGQRYALLDQLRYLARTSAATPVGFAGLVGLAMGAVRPGLRLPAALTLSVAALVLLQGKLIDYHRVPLQLLLCAWCGYLVARLLPGATAAGGLRVQARRLAVALLVVVALADFARGDTARAYLELWSAPSEAHARREESEIARFLARRTEPGESVLIWGVAGAGMIHFESRRPSPSRFVEIYPFSRSGPESDLTRRWKQEFIAALRSRPPAFVVVVGGDAFPAIGNLDSARSFREFAALRRFVDASYLRLAEVKRTFQYTFFVRRDRTRVDRGPGAPAGKRDATP